MIFFLIRLATGIFVIMSLIGLITPATPIVIAAAGINLMA